MRHFTWLLLVLAACAPMVAGPGRVLPARLQYDPASFAEEPTPPRAPRPPTQTKLSNGLQVTWLRDRTATVARASVLIRCGRGDEPLGAPGQTEFMLTTAFTAGAGTRSASQQHAALGAIAARPEVHVDDGESWVDFNVAPQSFPTLIELVADALQAPRFEAAAFAAEQAHRVELFSSPSFREAMKRRQLHSAAIYGSVPALSQPRTVEAERARSVEQVRAYATRCLQGPNVMLAVTGDFEERVLMAALQPLAALPAETPAPREKAGSAPTTRTLWLSAQPTDSRVEITLLGPGLAPGSRERPAAVLLMALMQSSLLWNLRTRSGHAYSLEAEVESGPGTGTSFVRFTTRREVALEALRSALHLLQSAWDRWPVDDEDLRNASRDVRVWLARRSTFERVFDAARTRMQDGAAFDPRDLFERLDDVKSPAQLSAFFAHAFRPDALQIIVSGAFDPDLDWAQFGRVVKVPGQ